MTESMQRRVDVVDLVLTTAEARTSAVLGGSMGVGKSHLLDTVSERLRAGGWIVTTIRANPAAATIPFGALASFVAGGEGVDRLAMLQSGVGALAGLAQGRPHLIAIDDAPMLDDQSVAVLHQLSVDHAVPLVATARSSDRESVALRSLWRHVDAVRIELGPLDDTEATEIVAERLARASMPTTDVAAEEIVRRAAGNPLFLIELVRAHLDGSRLTPQLRDLVAGRIEGLDDETRHQLRLVAVADPFDVGLDTADRPALEQLELEGLIRTHDDEEFVLARPAHPLFGEVVRGELSALVRRDISRELSESMARRAVTRRGDALRLAGWLRACGDRPAPELAATAAIEAVSWLDVDLARELAEIGVTDGPSFTTLFAAGEIARLTGDIDNALEVWTEAFDIAERDDDIRRVAMALAQVHGWFRNESDEAVRILEVASARMTDPAQRLECESERALFAALLGRYEEVVATATGVLEHPDASSETQWTALTNLTWAEAQLNQLAKLDEHFDLARQLLHVVADERVGEIDLMYGVIVSTWMQRGRLDSALDAVAEAEGDGRPTGATMFCAAQVHLALGDLTAARRAAKSAVTQLESYDPFNTGPLAVSMAAMCEAVAGDVDAARSTIERAMTNAIDVNGVWERIWFARARAWLAAAEGRTGDALTELEDAVAGAIETGHRGWAFFSMIDVVGWWRPGDERAVQVLADFAELARTWRGDVDGADFVLAIMDTITALDDGDVGRLDETIGYFVKMENRLVAAAAWWASALLVSDPVDACRRATRGSTLIPWALLAASPGADLALSDRQMAVARRAANGASSKAIADELFLSARTVDNHLRAAYRRLGVSSRSDLSELFAD